MKRWTRRKRRRDPWNGDVCNRPQNVTEGMRREITEMSAEPKKRVLLMGESYRGARSVER